MDEGVKILDAGARLVLTGTDAEEVKSALHAFLTRGAKLVSPPTQLGGKWVTACTVLVEPDTLENAAAEDEDPCKVRYRRRAQHRLQVVMPCRGNAHPPMR